jgi:hypothetical protein
VNQHRARVVSRARLTAGPTGSQVFRMAAPMVVPIPEVWVSAVTAEPTAALTAEPTEVPMVEPTVAQMEALMVAQMEALTAGPMVELMAAQTVGRVDA